jgi:hypothetical protein
MSDNQQSDDDIDLMRDLDTEQLEDLQQTLSDSDREDIQS